MDESVKRDTIILLFDRYSTDSRNLKTSFEMAELPCEAVTLEEDGFLPKDVISPIGFFLGDFENNKNIPGKPRYFNEIEVPDYWEIGGNNSNGKILNKGKERGKIFYTEPLHKRLVKVVDWYDERGVVRSSDHYNQYGALYGRTVFNAKGQRVNKSYFSAEGREIIVENYVTGDLILTEENKVKIFHTKLDFFLYFFEKAGFMENRIYFNSLSTPFFISERLHAGKKQDLLFWQEPVDKAIPGNMQIILQGRANRTLDIMVQKQSAYDRLLELGADSKKIHKLGFLYPFERENLHRRDVLICTNSDRIEHCHRLVKALPELHFHIAALTEMSSKLMSVGAYSNVTLYPGAGIDTIEKLFSKCDYYFDTNHEGEIVTAVWKAFLHNQLIFAFQETAHNKDYVAAEHIFQSEDVEHMINRVKEIVASETLLEQHLQLQREAAMTEDRISYKELLLAMIEKQAGSMLH